MSAGIPLSEHSTFTLFEQGILSTRCLQKQVSLISMQSPTQESVDTTSYPESAAQWLVGLLNLLAGIVNRNEDLSRVVVTEIEYQQLSAVMDDLIYGVGDDENHPLSAAMTLVGMLIKTYEDQHFPKLADIFPELAKTASVEPTSEMRNASSSISDGIDTDFAAAFFSIGHLFSEAGKEEKAISAYNMAIRIKQGYA